MAGGDASECSRLLANFACADFIILEAEAWFEGGGVIAMPTPFVAASSSSLGPSMLSTGDWSSRRIAAFGVGVRGIVVSDIATEQESACARVGRLRKVERSLRRLLKVHKIRNVDGRPSVAG